MLLSIPFFGAKCPILPKWLSCPSLWEAWKSGKKGPKKRGARNGFRRAESEWYGLDDDDDDDDDNDADADADA